MAKKASDKNRLNNKNASDRLARLHPTLQEKVNSGLVKSARGNAKGASTAGESGILTRLQENDLDSAHAIASMTQAQFLRKMAGSGSGGLMKAAAPQDDTLAREVYLNAVNIKGRAGHLAANIKDTLGSPHFRATAFYNVPDETTRQFESMPSYRSLFGRLDYCSCDHCNSIFSPAAYFLDLMRLIDQHVTNENTDVPDGYALEDRRPDLFELKLDCDNTNRMVPFLELVNSVLEKRLAKELDVKDVFRSMADARYPMNLPFNLPHTELRTYLEKLGTSFADIIEAYSPTNRQDDMAWRSPMTTASGRECLGLSLEQAALLTSPEPKKSAAHFGLKTLESYLPSFVIAAGTVDVSGATVAFNGTKAAAEIGDQILCNGDIRLVVGQSGAAGVIVDRPWPGEINGKDFAIAPMTAGKGRLSANAGSDVVRGKRTQLENLAKGDRIRCASVLRTIVEVQEDSHYLVDEAFPESFEDQPYCLDRSGALDHLEAMLQHLDLTHEAFTDLLRQDLSTSEIAQGGQGGLFLNQSDDELPTLEIQVDHLQPNDPFYRIFGLSPKRLDRLSRFVRLSRQLGWTFAENETVLRSLSAGEITSDVLTSLAKIKELAIHLRASPSALTGYWGVLSTDGKGDDLLPKDPFGSVFNDPVQGARRQQNSGAGPKMFDPERPAKWHVNPQSGAMDDASLRQNDETSAHLGAALRISNDDLVALGEFLTRQRTVDTLAPDGIILDQSNLSWLYRLAGWARMLNLSGSVFVRLLTLIEYPADRFEFTDPDQLLNDALDLIAIGQWMKRSGFNVDLLDYIIEGRQSAKLGTGFQASHVPDLLQSISALSDAARISPDSFQIEDVPEDVSSRVFDVLMQAGLIDQWGLVTGSEGMDVSFDFLREIAPIGKAAFANLAMSDADLETVLSCLTKNGVISQVDGNGILAPDFDPDAPLDYLFDDGAAGQMRDISAHARGLAKLDSSWDDGRIPGPFARYLILDYVKRGSVEKGSANSAVLQMSTPEDPTSIVGMMISVSRAGPTQWRRIVEFDAAENRIAVDRPWEDVPNNRYGFELYQPVGEGIARGGDASTLRLAKEDQSSGYAGKSVLILSNPEASTNRAEIRAQLVHAFDTIHRIKKYTGLRIREFADLQADNVRSGLATYFGVPEDIGRLSFDHLMQRDKSASSEVFLAPFVAETDAPPQPLLSAVSFVSAEHEIGAEESAEYITKALLEQGLLTEHADGFIVTSHDEDSSYLYFLWEGDDADKTNDRRKMVADVLALSRRAHTLWPKLDQLARLFALYAQVELTAPQVQALLARPELFGTQSISSPSIADIHALTEFKALTRELEDDEQNQLLSSYYKAIRTTDRTFQDKTEALLDLTGWQRAQFSAVAAALDITPPDATVDCIDVAGVKRLQSAFALARQLGVDARDLVRLAQLSAPREGRKNQNTDDERWSAYCTAANRALGALKARSTPEVFSKEFGAAQDHLDTVKRDALMRYAIWVLGKENPTIRKPSDLFSYLLLDVEMTSCDTITPIAQAIASAQLYLQRCRMRLEPGIVDLSGLPEKWWPWISTYRAWEANRKVFLYPENYIDPALRKSAAPEFKQFADAMMQMEINDENVGTAYQRYFDTFAEIANLVHCASYNHREQNPSTGEMQDTFHLFGRTRTAPYTFYHRTFDRRSAWTPWQEVDLSINASQIAPVIAFDRLFVFWSEIVTLGSAKISGQESTDQYRSTAKLFYSFQKPSGTWVEPQILIEDLEIAKTVGDKPAEKTGLFWLQPHALSIRSGETGRGRVDLVSGSYAVMGQQTRFKAQFQPGDTIVCAGVSRVVERIDSDTELTVDDAWPLGCTAAMFTVKVAERNRRTHRTFAGTGTIVGSAENKLTGAGTFFLSELVIGDTLVVNNERAIVQALESDTVVVLANIIECPPEPPLEFVIAPARQPAERLLVLYGGLDAGEGIASPWAIEIDENLLSSGPVTLGILPFDHTLASNPQPFKLSMAQNGTLAVSPTDSVTSDNYFGGVIPGMALAEPALGTNNLLWNCTPENVSIKPVSNQPGQFIFNNGDEAFLVKADLDQLATLSEIARLEHPTAKTVAISEHAFTTEQAAIDDIRFGFERLTTNAVGPLEKRLFAGGIDRLLSIEAQETSELQFDRFFGNPADGAGMPANIDPPISDMLDFKGAYGLYFWDLFFHIPFLAGNRLSDNLQFEEAQRWYHFLFNPTHPPENGLAHPNDRYWRFRPLRSDQLDIPSLQQTLQNKAEVDAYNNDPFDPHAIAKLRPVAYAKSIVMKYVDNLIRWGDHLFAQDTREAITQATNLYVMASDLLGKRPEPSGPCAPHAPRSFKEIRHAHGTYTVLEGKVKDTWNRVGNVSRFTSISAANSGAFWALGDGLIYRGKDNTPTALGTMPDTLIAQIATSHDLAIVWVRADDGRCFSLTNDTDWQEVPDLKLKHLAVGSAAHIWGITFEGGVGHWSGEAFTPIEFPEGKVPMTLDVSDDGAVWIIAADTENAALSCVYRWDGVAWLPAMQSEVTQFNQITVSGATGAWALDDTGRVLRWDEAATSFSKPLSDHKLLADISVGSDGALYGIGLNTSKGHLFEIGYEAGTIQLTQAASEQTDAYAGMDIRIVNGAGVGQTVQITRYDPTTQMAQISPSWQTLPDETSTYVIEGHGIPQFLVDLETSPAMDDLTSEPGDAPRFTEVPFNALGGYFCVPENQEFTEYWDRVEDRLFKIRHCQNISGTVRSLAPFAAPLDPGQLVRGAAGGGGLTVTSSLDAGIPHYRFRHMLERAKSATATVIQLGSTLSGILERKDAEDLALLRSGQEASILSMTTGLKEKQLEDIQKQLDALDVSAEAAKERFEYYEKLESDGLSGWEMTAMSLSGLSGIASTVSAATAKVAAVAHNVPQVGAPTAMTYGGKQVGDSVNSVSRAAGAIAAGLKTASDATTTLAIYHRRAVEWEHQKNLASHDKDQIESQAAASEIRLQIAQRELDLQQKSIAHNEETERFLKDKFSNAEIYGWMAGRISTVYFQAYSLAIDLAKSAERAFQYELNSEKTFVKFGYWDSLRKGLLAGEGLMLSLGQMEKEAMDTNDRRLEIVRTISLKQLNPQALEALKFEGECMFELGEALFDGDFPGHYARKIKTISISIPAVVGPYQSIKATLTQMANQELMKPELAGVEFLSGLPDAERPSPDVLRSNWRTSQQIALSRGIDDNGLFMLDFHDERYLPFEGTGAVSSWRLRLPKENNPIDFDAVADVIVTLHYTARDGGDAFADDVRGLDTAT